MRIAGKIVLGYAVIATLAVGIGLISHRAAEHTRLHNHALVERHLPVLSALHELRFHAVHLFEEAATRGLEEASHTGGVEPHGHARHDSDLGADNAVDHIQAAFSEYEQRVLTHFPEELEFVEQIRTAWEHTRGTRARLPTMTVEAIQDGRAHDAVDAFRAARDPLLELIARAIDHENDEIEELREQVAATIEHQLQLSLLMGVGAFVAALAIGTYLARRIARPIGQLQRAATALGGGDLEARADVRSTDETGVLAAAFNQMADSLGRTIHTSDYFEGILLSLADALIVVDTDFKIVKVNEITHTMLGYRQEELLGQPLSLIFPTSTVDSLSLLAESGVLRRGFAGTATRKSDSALSVLITGARLQEPASAGMVFVIKDITDLRRFQEQLVLKNQELKNEIQGHEHAEKALVRSKEQLQELVSELSKARDVAMEANRAKSAFLATMSHELRTPLNAIIGYSEMLEEETEEMHNDVVTSDLRRIRGAGQHLLQLINDILDLSKIEADRLQLHYESVDIRAVLQEIEETVRPIAEKNGNRLVLSVAPDVGAMEADPVRLRQILLNLLNNACKFTQDGTITLEATSTNLAKQPGYAFCVTDTGIGISAEDQAKLFQRFSQVDDSATRKFGGTGLGLAIVRRLCELLGGNVSVQSTMGAGSTFTAVLPAARPQSAAPSAESEALDSAVL